MAAILALPFQDSTIANACRYEVMPVKFEVLIRSHLFELAGVGGFSVVQFEDSEVSA